MQEKLKNLRNWRICTAIGLLVSIGFAGMFIANAGDPRSDQTTYVIWAMLVAAALSCLAMMILQINLEISRLLTPPPVTDPPTEMSSFDKTLDI